MQKTSSYFVFLLKWLIHQTLITFPRALQYVVAILRGFD